MPAVSAVLVTAILGLVLPSPLSAGSGRQRSSVKSQKASAKRHKSASGVKKTRKRSHRSSSSGSMRPSPVIYQDASGRVVLETFATPPLYGPFPPADLQDYPRPPCEPVDAVIEARLHDSDTDGDGPDEEAPEGQAAQAAPDVEAAGLARIAGKLGSFLRPKSPAAVVPRDVDLTELLSQGFRIPVEGVDAEKLRDSFLSARGRRHKHQHLAIDIGAPRGTPILATTDGEVVRITRERRGGKSIYQKDATGQYLLFYCHLSKYAENLQVGQKVVKGDVIGYVGSTGHVIGGPHLHFSITRLPDDAASFKQGLAINPYLLFLAGVP